MAKQYKDLFMIFYHNIFSNYDIFVLLDLGEYVNEQVKKESDSIRQVAVEQAVADTWETAHQIKLEAVKEALHKSQVQHEKQIRKLGNAF